MKEIPLGLTFDDVLIVPNHSNVKSRDDVNVSSWLTSRIELAIPIISSPMDTVTEWEMAQTMYNLGGFGFIHRYMSIEAQAAEAKKVDGHCGAAIGIMGDWEERLEALLDVGVTTIVIDVAYGDNSHVLKVVEVLAERNLDIIAGNVVTPEGVANLANVGASAIRVGIGAGSACSTRVATGIGTPQLTAILACAPMAKAMDVTLIADGGIRSGADVAKALAAGADTVMLGGMLAGADESPGAVMGSSDIPYPYKEYRGMASAEAQAGKGNLYSSNLYVEGVSGYVKATGSVMNTVNSILNGVRSAFSYVGAYDLEEFQTKAEFIRMTSAGMIESNPHDIIR